MNVKPVALGTIDAIGHAVVCNRRGARRNMAEVRRQSKLDARARPAPRLLYVVAEDWYFLSHRLPMARAAYSAGFEVHVATNVGEDAEQIRQEGFIVHPVRFVRGRLSPFRTLRTILALRKVYRTVDPAIVHYVAMQPTILGIVASFGRRGFASVYAITGLGHTFIADTGKARSLRRGIRVLLRVGLNRRRAIGLVQNPDDREMLLEIGVKPEHIALIPGSGIDADQLRPMPEPDGPVTVAYVGRMLDDKGVRTLMAAHRMLRSSNIACALLLAGTPDPANPASVSQIEVAGWGREPGVTWLGQVADIAMVWRRAHIAVLPSRREGLPKSLLEAAACGRPLIATDVPGCREIVIHDKTGLLVPVDDPQALAAAILRLVRSSQQRVRFGVAARRLVDDRFSADIIGKATVALYQRLSNG
jgi:glycosyltransferase involved in cell wall biosynthesis